MNATVSGHDSVVLALADARADPACADRSGWTALHWAAFRGDATLVQMLLTLGSNPSQRDGKGSTPREVAEHVLNEKKDAKFGEGLQANRDFTAVFALLPSTSDIATD